jgi:hypothetical protein
MAVVGGQTLLHLLAQRQGGNKLGEGAFSTALARYPSADVEDWNGRTPRWWVPWRSVGCMHTHLCVLARG